MVPWRRLLVYVTRYRRTFLMGLSAVVLTNALQLGTPWVIKYAVDDLSAAVTRQKLGAYAAAVLVLAAFGGMFRFLSRRILVGASRQIEYDLRNEFFAHLQRLSLGYFHQRRTGDLMSRATSDLGAVRMMIGPSVMYTSDTVLRFVVTLGLLLSIDARLTLVALLPMPFVSISVRYFGAAIHSRFERIQAQLSEVSAVTQETLAGVRVVRAYRQEPFELERFRASNLEYVARNRALIRLQGTYYPSLELLMGLSAMLVLWLGSREVSAGRMTVGELVAFNAYLLMLSWPMMAFGYVTNLLQRGLASWKRMLEVLDEAPAITDAEATADITDVAQIRGAVEFRRLTFCYGDAGAGAVAVGARHALPLPDAVLKDISLTVPAGTTTAIVGATGSGKSTLLALLPRLHEAPPGAVFIDGVDVRHIPLAVLREAIGFVPQDPFLFSDTIAGNIAYGARNGQGTPDRIAEAARVACLDKDLEGFPKGYDTVVGERGLTLSGGQKQRTAIARALIVDPRILILDDALSAVDTYTEEEILGRLAGVMRQRTSLIVSHRISTVRGADQIVVLDEGRIVERGTHDELVALNGTYAEMHQRQLLEEELEAS